MVLEALQLFVEWLSRHGLSLSLFGSLVLLTAVFVMLWWQEQRAEQPLLLFDALRDLALAAPSMLALLSDFSMFVALFYAPLLFQGGFGMSSQETGLVITPLVVCITLGSIINGRTVTCAPKPSTTLYAGFALLMVTVGGVSVPSQGTSHVVLILLMLLVGLGLGFVLPNLTMFTQQTAGRTHLGIAMALLQPLCMVGGMVGAALVGTLVNERYASGIANILSADSATQWLHRLVDPEILIDHDMQVALLSQLRAADYDGTALLETTRHVLADAIHIGLIVAMMVVLIGL